MSRNTAEWKPAMKIIRKSHAQMRMKSKNDTNQNKESCSGKGNSECSIDRQGKKPSLALREIDLTGI